MVKVEVLMARISEVAEALAKSEFNTAKVNEWREKWNCSERTIYGYRTKALEAAAEMRKNDNTWLTRMEQLLRIEDEVAGARAAGQWGAVASLEKLRLQILNLTEEKQGGRIIIVNPE